MDNYEELKLLQAEADSEEALTDKLDTMCTEILDSEKRL